MDVEMFFDFSSPYAYFASEQIEAVCDGLGVGLRWRPIMLGPIFKRTGAKPLLNDGVRGEYARMDCRRWAQLNGVPYREPAAFPVNSLKAARGALALAQDPRLSDYVHGCFRTFWQHGQDISQDAVLAGIASDLGLDVEGFLAATQTPAIKQRLVDETEQAWNRGVFGAPTFLVAGERLWGNDRLPMLGKLIEHQGLQHRAGAEAPAIVA